MSIMIQEAILHILDSNSSTPIYSAGGATLEIGTSEYLRMHLEQMMEDDTTQRCTFNETSTFPDLVNAAAGNFLEASQRIAAEIFKYMRQSPFIPSADLFCVLFMAEDEQYMGVLKLNYKEGYTHYCQQAGEEGGVIELRQQNNLLPASTSKLSEAFIINLAKQEIWLREKKFEIDGEKAFYLSARLLNCVTHITEKSKLLAVKKAAQQINQELYGDKLEKEQELAATLYEQLSSDEPVPIQELCGQIYEEDPQAAQSLLEALEKKEIHTNDTIKVSSGTVQRLEKQSFKTQSGIEIKIPVHLVNHQNPLTFTHNPDGTVTVSVNDILV